MGGNPHMIDLARSRPSFIWLSVPGTIYYHGIHGTYCRPDRGFGVGRLEERANFWEPIADADEPNQSDRSRTRQPRPTSCRLGRGPWPQWAGHAERTDVGILIGPCPRYTWDEIFATKLSVRPGDSAAAPDISEVSGDDL